MWMMKGQHLEQYEMGKSVEHFSRGKEGWRRMKEEGVWSYYIHTHDARADRWGAGEVDDMCAFSNMLYEIAGQVDGFEPWRVLMFARNEM